MLAMQLRYCTRRTESVPQQTPLPLAHSSLRRLSLAEGSRTPSSQRHDSRPTPTPNTAEYGRIEDGGLPVKLLRFHLMNHAVVVTRLATAPAVITVK